MANGDDNNLVLRGTNVWPCEGQDEGISATYTQSHTGPRKTYTEHNPSGTFCKDFLRSE